MFDHTLSYSSLPCCSRVAAVVLFNVNCIRVRCGHCKYAYWTLWNVWYLRMSCSLLVPVKGFFYKWNLRFDVDELEVLCITFIFENLIISSRQALWFAPKMGIASPFTAVDWSWFFLLPLSSHGSICLQGTESTGKIPKSTLPMICFRNGSPPLPDVSNTTVKDLGRNCQITST